MNTQKGVAPSVRTLAGEALEEWRALMHNFNYVNGADDPELVDAVCYQIKAAESRFKFYKRIMKEARM